MTDNQDLAIRALTSLNPPTLEQLALALEKAEDDVIEYGDLAEESDKRVLELETELRIADDLLTEIRELHLDEKLTLPEYLVKQIEKALD